MYDFCMICITNLLLKNLETSTALQQILNLSTRYGQSVRDRLLNLLSEILNKRYPTVEEITESELMEWKMWPSFLRMIGMYIIRTYIQYIYYIHMQHM